MQQALYNHINIALQTPSSAPAVAPIRPSLRRRIALNWERWGVVALMASSGVYALGALLHLA